MGIWFNPLPAAQPPLTLDSCRAKIYQLMQLTCFPSEGGPFNVAAVNLQTLPDADTNGSQVDPGYPSYVIVPETYDDVFTDVPADGGTGDGDGDESEY
ncbi:MAG: hypothetical protein ASARMPRED_006584 [Alectoria sarmentosa]|nr:MAG: hypothetical protein ASARMPRED_006584 [Alectoria sarmentosa]